MPSLLPFLLLAALGLLSPAPAAAQQAENVEARTYFEEGNRLFQEASTAHGSKRTRLLQRALESYVDSLQIVRSRNALFNAAIALDELGRHDESFNYFSEYLRVQGLSTADREEATRRQDALRMKVAVLRVRTEPPGALLWVDRKDLAPRGETPIELALPPGQRRAFIEMPGYAPIVRTQTIVRGETVVVDLPLSPLPVRVTVETDPDARVLLNGDPIDANAPVNVQPGRHQVRVERDGQVRTRELNVAVGDEPLLIAMPLPSPPPVPEPSPRPRIRNTAIGTAASTLVTAGVALGLSLHARSLRDDYNNAAAVYQLTRDPADLSRAEDLADQTDRYNLAADVLWGTTIALGVSAIALYAVHRKRQKRETPGVSVSVSRQGGFASFRMPVGARQ